MTITLNVTMSTAQANKIIAGLKLLPPEPTDPDDEGVAPQTLIAMFEMALQDAGTGIENDFTA